MAPKLWSSGAHFSLLTLQGNLVGSSWAVICNCPRFHGNSPYKSLQGLYKIAGLKGQPVCFIFTDAEVKDDSFLEYINQLLMTGELLPLRTLVFSSDVHGY